MSELMYKKDLCPNNKVKNLIEQGRILDFRDEKWAHPAIREHMIPWHNPSLCDASLLYNPDVSKEEKIKMGTKLEEDVKKITAQPGGLQYECDIQTYVVPGCPEEPEAEVEIQVYRPKNAKKRKARCMFYCIGGGLVLVSPESFPIPEIATRYNCVLVTVIYRKSYIAEYPAAINDLHAGYQWMTEHAEELGINSDNVVIQGCSSGGHLALALGFRLKRYGYSPKGIVAAVPQTDDREKGYTGVYDGMWDTVNQHNALKQWLGTNFASSLVGPEALANHATVEECIGYPPTFIHTTEFDPDRHFCREFYGKLLEARTYAEFHSWGGAQHCSPWQGVTNPGEVSDYTKVVKVVYDANVEDCFKYDLRRPWVAEEYRK